MSRAFGRSAGDLGALSEAEQRLLACVKKGEPCQFGGRRPDPDKATPENSIRPELIRFLALGGDEGVAIHERGIALSGAFITGPLDLQGTELQHFLRLTDCHIDGPIDLTNAEAMQIDLTNSRVAGISATGAKIAGNVVLKRGFLATGEVLFSGSVIGGDFDCGGGTIESPETRALSLSRCKIGGSVFLNRDFTAKGEIRIRLAEIGGNLDCNGGNFGLTSDRGACLRCDGARITGGVFLGIGFSAYGEVRFPVTEIGGDFICAGGQFHNPQGDALILIGSQIRGRLVLSPLPRETDGYGQYDKPVHADGKIRLSEARARVVRWEGLEGLKGDWCSELDGFTYERISGDEPASFKLFKSWLTCQRKDDSGDQFRPQPFEQLIKVLREMGYDENAREIGHYKQRHESLVRLKRADWWWKPPLFLWRYLFLDLLAGYGYRPYQAIMIALGIWLFCAYVYSQAAGQGGFVPDSAVLTVSNFKDDKGETLAQACRPVWTECTDPRMREYTTFNAYMYSADLIFPIVSFGQDEKWTPMLDPVSIEIPVAGKFTLPGNFVRALTWFEIAFGWVAGLILAAVLSGAIKKD
jgi:hypothetical protein